MARRADTTRALISDQSIARGLELFADNERDRPSTSGKDKLDQLNRCLISDESIARGLSAEGGLAGGSTGGGDVDADAASLGGDSIDSDGCVDLVQGELFLDPIDEDGSDLENHVEDAEPSTLYQIARIRVADAKLALLKSLVLATKFARMAILLQAKQAEQRTRGEGLARSSEEHTNLRHLASTRIPQIPSLPMEESDILLASGNPFAQANGNLISSGSEDDVTEAELNLIAQCQQRKLGTDSE
eukprot:g1089.t1